MNLDCWNNSRDLFPEELARRRIKAAGKGKHELKPILIGLRD